MALKKQINRSDLRKKIREITQYLVAKFSIDKIILIAALLLLVSVNAESRSGFAANLTFAEQIGYMTVRIEVQLPLKDRRTGTGFICLFNDPQKGTMAPSIVTNKHVVEGAISGTFFMTLADSLKKPIPGRYKKITIDDFESRWIFHPEVDLAAMPIEPILKHYDALNIRFYFTYLQSSLISDESLLNSLSAVEDILMVGYPNGLWDRLNNLPIYRTGITATHPAMDYNGKTEFLIDAACIPGSSGSPIFLFNEIFFTRNDTTFQQNRYSLLGVLYAGPVFSATGDIIIKPIPSRLKSVTNIPINLGFVIKAERVKELGELVKERLASK